MNLRMLLTLCLCLFISQGSELHAGLVVLNTDDYQFTQGQFNQGFWSDNLSNTNDNLSYWTGFGNLGESEYRSFFTFNLDDFFNNFPNDIVTSATLQIVRGTDNGMVNSYDLRFFDVSTDAQTLNNNEGINTEIFNDLGTGKNYGQFTVPSSNNTAEVLSFNLNSNALEDINSQGQGFFSIGGRLFDLPIDTFLTDNESFFDLQSTNFISNNLPFNTASSLFGNTNAFSATLTLQSQPNTAAVPEPTTLLLCSLGGLCGIAYKRRRKLNN